MENNIWIQEQYVEERDSGERYGCGDSGIYETCYYHSEKRKLFDSLQREYGPCRGKVYIDKGNSPVAIGWFFEKRVKVGKRECATMETWVTLYKSKPETVYHYL